MSQHEDESLGERSAQLGVLVNAALVAVKLVAGVVGNSYALVADAVESTADIFRHWLSWEDSGWHAAKPMKSFPSATDGPRPSPRQWWP